MNDIRNTEAKPDTEWIYHRPRNLTRTGSQATAATLGANPFIRELVSSTIQAWDAEEMSNKLEATVGSDLQFIRLNGTFVGGLIGLAIHATFLLIGK